MRERARERERERERERQTDRQTDRQTETELGAQQERDSKGRRQKWRVREGQRVRESE